MQSYSRSSFVLYFFHWEMFVRFIYIIVNIICSFPLLLGFLLWMHYYLSVLLLMNIGLIWDNYEQCWCGHFFPWFLVHVLLSVKSTYSREEWLACELCECSASLKVWTNFQLQKQGRKVPTASCHCQTLWIVRLLKFWPCKCKNG